jgi:hypothetical protein
VPRSIELSSRQQTRQKKGASSLRVTVVGFVVIFIIFLLTVVFLFVFFLIRLLPKAHRGGYREIRTHWGETVWRHGGHVQMVRSYRWVLSGFRTHDQTDLLYQVEC